MKKYVMENNSYFVFQKEQSEWMVYFLWGKFDFRVYLQKTDQARASRQKRLGSRSAAGEYFTVERLQHLIHGEWFDYAGTTEHGFTFEETKWTKGTEVHYIEFPKELLIIATSIAAQEFELQPL